jgi:hypothetical protein
VPKRRRSAKPECRHSEVLQSGEAVDKPKIGRAEKPKSGGAVKPEKLKRRERGKAEDKDLKTKFSRLLFHSV